jgi:hypothetical protein
MRIDLQAVAYVAHKDERGRLMPIWQEAHVVLGLPACVHHEHVPGPLGSPATSGSRRLGGQQVALRSPEYFLSRADLSRLLRLATAADLKSRTFPGMTYVVPDILAEGLTLLAGRPKLGKSWLMLDIGLAVAAGRFCLGDKKCLAGDVLYLALEDNERRLQRRIDKIFGAFTEWPRSFQYATEWPRAKAGGVEAVREWVMAANSPRLVVVDVLAMFRPVGGNKDNQYEADYSAIKSLQALAGEFNIAIVVVHHTRKSGSEVDPFEKASGTLGLSGAADAVLILDRDSAGATLYGRGRDVEELEIAVTFNPANCRWTVLGKAADVRRSDERSVIAVTLKEATEPMTPVEIADAISAPRNNVRQLLFKMAKDGEVVKVTRPKGYVHPENAARYLPPDNSDNAITSGDGVEP